MSTENKKPPGILADTIGDVEIIFDPTNGYNLWCSTCLRVIATFYKNTTKEAIETEAKKHNSTHK